MALRPHTIDQVQDTMNESYVTSQNWQPGDTIAWDSRIMGIVHMKKTMRKDDEKCKVAVCCGGA